MSEKSEAFFRDLIQRVYADDAKVELPKEKVDQAWANILKAIDADSLENRMKKCAMVKEAQIAEGVQQERTPDHEERG